MTNGNTRTHLIKENAMEMEYAMENSPHSPTDSSEDSVEVKVEIIAGRQKRKLSEPRRLSDGPLKKRLCIREEAAPFRPWKTTPEPTKLFPTPPLVDTMTHSYFHPPSPTRPRSPSPSPGPVDLIKKTTEVKIKEEPELRIPIHPNPTDSIHDTEDTISNTMDSFPKLQHRKEQRNYKNMTRERRIEANARERTRVHTISAAFDTLRKSVPAYSHSQKLSKLSVLRIACSYIMTLSNMLQDSPDTAQTVENVSRTIQREGKLRKKKDED